MKNKTEIKEEIEKTNKWLGKHSKEYNTLNYMYFMGYRDGLEWVLEEPVELKKCE